MKRVNWHIPEAAGFNVWPNVSSTRDELRYQVSGQSQVQGRCSEGALVVHASSAALFHASSPVSTTVVRAARSCPQL